MLSIDYGAIKSMLLTCHQTHFNSEWMAQEFHFNATLPFDFGVIVTFRRKKLHAPFIWCLVSLSTTWIISQFTMPLIIISRSSLTLADRKGGALGALS